MKKNIIMSMIAFILLINMISAVQFYQTKEYRGNNTIRIHSFVQYQQDEVVIDTFTTSYIKNGNPLQLAIKYNTYIDTWNQRNIYNKVSYCNLSIKYYPRYANQSVLLFNDSFTDDTAINNYFVTLNINEEFSVDMDCKFKENYTTGLEIPVSLSIDSSTWECKSCQLYLWNVQERQVNKAKSLHNFTLNIISYISKVIMINFESLLSLFWIGLIFIFLYSFSLIFEIGIFLIKFVNGIRK